MLNHTSKLAFDSTSQVPMNCAVHVCSLQSGARYIAWMLFNFNCTCKEQEQRIKNIYENREKKTQNENKTDKRCDNKKKFNRATNTHTASEKSTESKIETGFHARNIESMKRLQNIAYKPCQANKRTRAQIHIRKNVHIRKYWFLVLVFIFKNSNLS